MGGLTFDDLTETECWLANAAVDGDLLDLVEPDEDVTEESPAGAERQRCVRAEVIRQLLIGEWPAGVSADPRGVRLRGARVVGELDLSDVRSTRPLSLIDCHCADGLRLSGAHLPALDLSGLVSPWVLAPGAGIERDLWLTGARVGTVNVHGAQVGGMLSLDAARLGGPGAEAALLASDLHTGGGVFLNRGFRAEGGGDGGTIRLSGAVIGGVVSFAGAGLSNPDGPALVADNLRTGGNLMLDEGFHAHGRKDTGTVRLVGASIGGRLDLEGERVVAARAGALALNLGRTQVAGDVLFPMAFLDGAINLDGFRYAMIRRSSVTELLDLFATRTNHYASQPYRQLASAHQAAGNERGARLINIAAQRDLLRRGRLDARARIWLRVIGIVLGFGYQPGRALLWWAATVGLAALLTVGIAGPAGLVTAGAHGAPCSVVDQFGLALNTATPLVKPADASGCALSTSGPLGAALTVVSWVVQALAWAFVTLFVAGFTGVVRRN